VKKLLALALACGTVGVSAAFAARSTIELPTEWHLTPPTGLVVATGTLPQGAARTAGGEHLIVVEDGQAAAAARIFDAATLAPERTIALDGASGAPLPDATGTGFWVSLAAGDAIAHVDAATGTIDRKIAIPGPFWPAAIARSPDGKTLAVDGDLAGTVRFIDIASGKVGEPISVGAHPFGVAYTADGKTLYIANWGEASVSAIDTRAKRVRATIPVGRHPEALALAPDGSRLYVSETDDDSIGIIDTATATRANGIAIDPFGSALAGASPTSLTLASGGTRLYATLSAINAVGVVDLGSRTPRFVGAMPTGWYPTAAVLSPDGKTLDVLDGKGESSHANPQFRPFARPRSNDGYVAHEMIGSLRRIAIPSDADLAAGTALVLADGGETRGNASVAGGLETRAGAYAPVPPTPSAVVRANGPIKHIIYIVKENRTFDQVLGDVPGANGDAKLVLFGANVTPNQHAIAKRFGVLDDTMADAQVSADGHNWTVGAFANDYLERMWPPNYGGRRKAYDFEDEASASTAHNGYLWNTAKRAGVSVRNYGEFTTAVAMSPAPQIVSHMKDLAEVTDPRFPGFDLAFSDLDRYAEWKREFDGYVRGKNLPQLEIVRLPNDHTAGTRPGSLTPAAFVAQNDAAVGKLVDAVSHSPYWRDTAIFIVEDDAQNGADHVDAERMTVYVASAYSAGGVVHEHHSTAGIVRTIETILDLPPLSVYDATTETLADAFAPGGKPDLRPFTALAPRVSITETNAATAYRARDSARMDFSREDAAPEADLGDIVAHASRPQRGDAAR